MHALLLAYRNEEAASSSAAASKIEATGTASYFLRQFQSPGLTTPAKKKEFLKLSERLHSLEIVVTHAQEAKEMFSF